MAVRYIALLRGINVGTAKRVAMADLRTIMEGLGYSDVSTLLNSGNVVFTSAKGAPSEASQRIQKALESRLDVSARAMVISSAELAEIVAANPLVTIADNPSRLLVGILSETEGRGKLEEIVKKDWGKERIALGPVGAGATGSGVKGPGGAARAVYMWTPQGVAESKLNAAVNKALGDTVTSRNWATMQKLNEMT